MRREELKENEVLKGRCEDLYNRTVELKAKEKKASVFENWKLYSYIKKLGKVIGFENSGERIAKEKTKRTENTRRPSFMVCQDIWFNIKFSCFFRARMARAIHCAMIKTKKDILMIYQRRNRIK